MPNGNRGSVFDLPVRTPPSAPLPTPNVEPKLLDNSAVPEASAGVPLIESAGRQKTKVFPEATGQRNKAQPVAAKQPQKPVVRELTMEEKCNALGRAYRLHRERAGNAVTYINPEPKEDDLAAYTRRGDMVYFFRLDGKGGAASANLGKGPQFKTVGAIGLEGGPILMVSSSGMKTNAPPQANLLDDTTWTRAVHNVCQMIDYNLPKNAYDHGLEGQFKACHVEKKLILWFVFHTLFNDGALGWEDKLEELRQRTEPLRVLLRMDKRACQNCMDFRLEIQALTGMIINFQENMILLQSEAYRDEGRKRYRLVGGRHKKPMSTIIAKQITAGGKIKTKTPPKKASVARVATPESDDDYEFVPSPSLRPMRIEVQLRARRVESLEPQPRMPSRKPKHRVVDDKFMPSRVAKRSPSPQTSPSVSRRSRALSNDLLGFDELDSFERNRRRKKPKKVEFKTLLSGFVLVDRRNGRPDGLYGI